MHTNHRTGKKARRDKKGWPRPYSLREYKQICNRRIRRTVRSFMTSKRYGKVEKVTRKTTTRKHLLWDYW